MISISALVLLSLASAQTQAPSNPEAPQSPDVHLGRGYEALKQDRYDVAIAEFRAALDLDPHLVLRAQFPLAVALFESHNFEQARSELEAVRKQVGDHPNVSYYLGRLDLESRDFSGAIDHLKQAAAEPPFPDTAYYLGFAYLKQSDLPNAEKWLKQAEQSAPHDARVPYQLGVLYRKKGQEEDARRAFALSEQLRNQDTDTSRIKVECGQKLDQGSRDEAHAICDKLYDPSDPEKLTALGTMYGQHGDPEAALKPLQRAAELEPQSPQMQYNLALTYYQLNRLEDARRPLSAAVKRWPDLFPLNALYGTVLFKLGDDRAAYETLRHAHQLNPQDAPAGDLLYMSLLGLARKRLKSGAYAASLQYFQEAVRLRPQEPAPHLGMAEVYRLTKRPAQAAAEQRESDRLTKLFGNSPQ